ncbi:MAG TPA: proton-conducting transporter membrane subunit [Gaiellaceae bacterium]|nr:proton-conducting transporter membrane subunit [Gaiellaceae bacterium]
MTNREWLALAVPLMPAISATLVAIAPRRVVAPLGLAAAGASGILALALSTVAIVDADDPIATDWLVVDATAGLFVGIIGLVGLGSALTSPGFLRSERTELVRAEQGPRLYWGTFLAFWAVLVAVPLAGNLGIAWLLIEATTAASALLVGFSGRARALEAGWKYLVLTTLGLGFALLGIALLAPNADGGLGGLSWGSLASIDSGSEQVSAAFVLLLGGLAAKIGWAPVHNWLPDAHSEAPPPVSALLSGALLPAVLVVAWRSDRALAPAVGEELATGILLGFGLVSLAVSVPFLWRSLAWKRLLAYSSLEHMGVLALGLAFANPLAMAGVVVHVTGHAVAKALGFYAATPLFAHVSSARRRAPTGVGRTSPALGASMGISLGTLAGLPPSPLFFSEILIVAGGFAAGRTWEAALAAVLLALGFLGLGHALIETVAGKTRRREPGPPRGLRPVVGLAAVATVILLTLTAIAPWLPSSDLVHAMLEAV